MFPDARALKVQSASLRRVVAKGNTLAKRHPLPFKALPTAVGFAFGDFLTQYMQWRKSRNEPQRDQPFAWEWTRGAKMALVGAVASYPLLLGWQALDGLNWGTHPHAGLLANSVKITLDQVVGCLLWQAAYMYVHPPYRVAAEQLLQSLQSNLEAQTQSITADVRRKLQPAPSL